MLAQIGRIDVCTVASATASDCIISNIVLIEPQIWALGEKNAK